MHATIEFQSAQVALIRVEASSFIYGTGTFAMVGAFVIGGIMIGQGVLFFQILGGALFLLAPFGWREVSKAADRADCTIELNKDALTVRHAVGTNLTVHRIDKFLEVQLYSINPPGDGRHLFGVKLLSKAGVVRLFALHSKEAVEQQAKELADWLSVPLVRLGYVSIESLTSPRPLL